MFDQNAKFIREMKYAGLPCSFAIGKDAVFMSNGFAGQVLKMDLQVKR